MSPRRSANVVASTPSGDITTEMILGYLGLLSVPNTPVSTTKLRRIWMAEGLDEKLVPKQRRPADVFMAACRSIESRRTEEDRTHEIKVDRVLESSEECVYQVTQLVRDKDHKLIEHPKAMRLTFTAKDGKIKDEAIDNRKLYKELQRLADTIRFEYEENGTKVPGNKVRGAIRETLLAEHATRVQNKGVYFVPKAARSTLDSIANVLEGLYKEGGAELAVLPLASDKAEKEMVKRHFSENVQGEVDELLAECSSRLNSDVPPRGDRKATLVNRRREIGVAVAQYQTLLDTRLDVLQEGLKLLDDGLERVMLMAA